MIDLAISRQNEVWTALDSVMDPELDESVTSLEFVTDVEVDAQGRVGITWRLPTYWCSPNFAFLMSSDMRDATRDLPWVKSVSVKLLDHFSAELINRGVDGDQDFREAFPGESDDDLQSVRAKFLGKAFERRQELLVRHLLGAKHSADALVAYTLSDLLNLPLNVEGERLRNMYVWAWRRVYSERAEADLAFVSLEKAGCPLEAATLRDHLRKVGGVRRNAEYNSFICRSLLTERNNDLLATAK